MKAYSYSLIIDPLSILVSIGFMGMSRKARMVDQCVKAPVHQL